MHTSPSATTDPAPSQNNRLCFGSGKSTDDFTTGEIRRESAKHHLPAVDGLCRLDTILVIILPYPGGGQVIDQTPTPVLS